jgi:hypothetical protein
MNVNESLLHPLKRPFSVTDLQPETQENHAGPWQQTWPEGTWRKTLSIDPVTQGATFLLYLPPGYGRAEEAEVAQTHPRGRFEAHTCHEEIFNLGGNYRFGDYYTFPEMGYINHPPNWVHPANQSTDTGVLLLIKNSAPVSFDFTLIPEDWNGVEGTDRGTGNLDYTTGGVTLLPTDAAPWHKLSSINGTELGLEAKHIWQDSGSGWSTWIMKAPRGWVSPVAASTCEGGDEMFLLEGDFTHSRHGRLEATSYYSDSDDISFGGESSENGCVAIRWSKGNSQFSLPDLIEPKQIS